MFKDSASLISVSGLLFAIAFSVLLVLSIVLFEIDEETVARVLEAIEFVSFDVFAVTVFVSLNMLVSVLLFVSLDAITDVVFEEVELSLLTIDDDSNCLIVVLFEPIILSFSDFSFSKFLISSFNVFFSVASFVLVNSFLSTAIKSVTSLLYFFRTSFCLLTSSLFVLSIGNALI